MPRNTTRLRYFFDEFDPDKIYSLADLQSEHAALLDLIPSDGRSFEEFLFDANYRNGGTLKEFYGAVKSSTCY